MFLYSNFSLFPGFTYIYTITIFTSYLVYYISFVSYFSSILGVVELIFESVGGFVAELDIIVF